jgi:WD40 repeat protein
VSDTSNPENHNDHNTYSLEEYHRKIKEKKKYLKKLDDCLKLIDSKEEEITKDFSNRCEESKKQIEDIIKTMEKLRDDYMSKYEQEMENLKNIFLIIRQSYKNFYKELDGDKIDLASFNFITNIKGELNNIIYNPLNFEHIENAYNSLNKINFNKYYNIKFDFRNLVYEKNQTIELDEGITAICPLKSLKKSFACGTSKGKIQIYIKEDDYEYNMKAEAKGNQNSVSVLLETLRPEKYIISGTSNKSIRIYSIEITSKNNEKTSCNLSFKKELSNSGSILSIFQLGDGRLASRLLTKK